MNGTTALRADGQKLWLDTISRRLLDSGTLQHYIDAYGLTGVTSNPTILSREIAEDEAQLGPSTPRPGDTREEPEAAVLAEAVHDVQGAADLFRPMWESTHGSDGWVSIEVPPALANLATATVQAGRHLHSQVDRPNVFIKVPATWPGVAAIEALTVAGVPTNATLVFDARQHHAVENGYLRGLERRGRMGLSLAVSSVASVFVSRWDTTTDPLLPEIHRHLMGLHVARTIDCRHRHTLIADRWTRLQDAGASPQRLVWASTSPKDPDLEPAYYAARLPRTDTINTMPENVLLTLAEQSDMPPIDPREFERGLTGAILAQFGVDETKVADTLQRNGVRAFAADWDALVARRANRVGLP